MAHGLENIDWQAPWLAHLRERGEAAANGIDDSTDVFSVLNELVNHDAQTKTAVKFVPQDMPWLASKEGEEINYELAFYREAPYSVRNYGNEIEE